MILVLSEKSAFDKNREDPLNQPGEQDVIFVSRLRYIYVLLRKHAFSRILRVMKSLFDVDGAACQTC